MASVIYPDSGLAAVTFWNREMRLYFQNTDGFIIEAVYERGKWTHTDQIGPRARLGSPLAAVSWGAATNPSILPQLRVFYQADQANLLSEHTFGKNGSGWMAGTLQSLRINSTRNSLAACMVADADIRLYYMESGASTYFNEVAGNGASWNITGSAISTGSTYLSTGTSLAAVGEARYSEDSQVWSYALIPVSVIDAA